MREDDFVEVMREVVPQLIDQALHETGAEASTRAPAVKRSLDAAAADEQPFGPRRRSDDLEEEALLVSEV